MTKSNQSIQYCMLAGASVLLVSLVGCSTSNDPTLQKSVRVSQIATEQLPPEPTYNRYRYVQLPSPALAFKSEERTGAKPMVDPIYEVSLTKQPVEEIAGALASLVRFQSYTASSVAKKKVTLRAIGTLNELANELARVAKVEVVIEHDTRTLRVFPESSPRFYNGSEDQVYEYQQDNQATTLR